VSVIHILNGLDILAAPCSLFILKLEILVSYCYCRNLLSWFYFPSRKTNKWSVRSDELRKLYSKPKLPSRTFTSFIRVMGWDWNPCYCPFLLPSLTKKMKHWWKDNWQENTEMFEDKQHMCHFAYFSHKRNIPVLNSSLRREKPMNDRLHSIDGILQQSTNKPFNQPFSQLINQPSTKEKQTSHRCKNRRRKFKPLIWMHIFWHNSVLYTKTLRTTFQISVSNPPIPTSSSNWTSSKCYHKLFSTLSLYPTSSH